MPKTDYPFDYSVLTDHRRKTKRELINDGSKRIKKKIAVLGGSTTNDIIKMLSADYVKGITLLGGEPFEPANQAALLPLIRRFKEMYPEKDIWMWTGFRIEDVFENLVDSGIDVVVDGKFVEELKDLRLKFRGSSNQRIIDLKNYF